jgi:hypothetical protein
LFYTFQSKLSTGDTLVYYESSARAFLRVYTGNVKKTGDSRNTGVVHAKKGLFRSTRAVLGLQHKGLSRATEAPLNNRAFQRH